MPPVDTSAALVAFQAQSGALKNLVKQLTAVPDRQRDPTMDAAQVRGSVLGLHEIISDVANGVGSDSANMPVIVNLVRTLGPMQRWVREPVLGAENGGAAEEEADIAAQNKFYEDLKSQLPQQLLACAAAFKETLLALQSSAASSPATAAASIAEAVEAAAAAAAEAARRKSIEVGKDDHSLMMKANGLRFKQEDGTTRVLLHANLPPILSIEDILRTWERTPEQQPLVSPPATSAPFSAPESASPASVSDIVPAASAAAASDDITVLENKRRYSQKPLPSPHTRSASASPAMISAAMRGPPPRSTERESSARQRRPQPPPKTYSMQHKSLLTSYSNSMNALTAWIGDLTTREQYALTKDNAAHGHKLVDTVISCVLGLMSTLDSPTKIVSEQVTVVASLYSSLFDAPARKAEAPPYQSSYMVTEATVTKFNAALFILSGSLKGAIALNVMLHRYSVFVNLKKQANSASLLQQQQPSQEVTKVFKLMVVGHNGAGKTAFVKAFQSLASGVANSIDPYVPTQGIDLKICKFALENETIELQVLDASGHRQLRATFEQMYNVVDGVFVLYDTTNASSFGDIHDWMRELEKYSFLQRILIANKIDVDQHRQIPGFRGQSLAEEYKVQHVEISCTKNVNIVLAFKAMLSLIEHTQKTYKNAEGDVDVDGDSDDEGDNYTDVKISSATRQPTQKRPSVTRTFVFKQNSYTFFTPNPLKK